MKRVFFLFLFITTIAQLSYAQPPSTKLELEKERKQLRKEIEENKKIQEKIKSATKDNLNTLIVVGRKAELQERIVENVAKDINMLDNNITGIQRDINKYDRLLDTLRQEYAKSMVYAYKNRGNYEFLNFIFSAENFNDAVKRIAYLKSYRTFREMQGQNILRTQELRRKRLEDLGVTRQTKNVTLTVQEQEMKKIAEQKIEQDKIVENLRKQGKSIEALIADKKKREAKINASIKAAIAKAIKEENDKRIAFEKAERIKRDNEKRAQAASDKLKRDAALKAKRDADALTAKRDADARAAAALKAKAQANIPKTNPTTTVPSNKPPVATTKPPVAVVKPPVAVIKPPVAIIEPPKESKVPDAVVYTSPTASLNASLERSRGTLAWPVDNHYVITHFGPYKLPSGLPGGFNNFVSIGAPIGSAVKAVFDGEVILIQEMEYGKYFITIKHGVKYYSSYVNVSSVAVRVNQEIKAGQVIGKVATNLDGGGSIDFSLVNGNSDINPELWLRR
jgi:murein hydrolase activator